MTRPALPSIAGEVVLDESTIAAKVRELAGALSELYAGKDLRLVTVLRGGLFFLADLARAIDIPLAIDFIGIAPYRPGHGGVAQVTKDLSDDIDGASVVLVEDVVDTGLTVHYVSRLLQGHNPASFEICALLDKPTRRLADVPIAHTGFVMPDDFLVGYGLDVGGPLPELALHSHCVRGRLRPMIGRLASGPKRVVVAVVALFAVVALGTIGYRIIEGWAWFDSLYMTVITIATVGFSEVHPLSEPGRAFTILLIITGISVQFVALATIVDYLSGGHLVDALEGRSMNRRIEGLRGHTIVCGIGRVGSVVARSLTEQDCDFIIVDRSDEAVELCREEGWLIVKGDAAEEETLQAAGIGRAKAIVTALDSDADNLFVTVTARALNPDVFIIARSSHESSEQKILKAGANRVITPNVIGGRRMAGMVMQPVVSDYLDLVAHGDGVEFRLQEYSVHDGSRLLGKTLSEARVREATGVYVLAVRSTDGRIDANPDSGFRFGQGDRVVALGTEQQLQAFAAFASRLSPGA